MQRHHYERKCVWLNIVQLGPAMNQKQSILSTNFTATRWAAVCSCKPLHDTLRMEHMLADQLHANTAWLDVIQADGAINALDACEGLRLHFCELVFAEPSWDRQRSKLQQGIVRKVLKFPASLSALSSRSWGWRRAAVAARNRRQHCLCIHGLLSLALGVWGGNRQAPLVSSPLILHCHLGHRCCSPTRWSIRSPRDASPNVNKVSFTIRDHLSAAASWFSCSLRKWAIWCCPWRPPLLWWWLLESRVVFR